MQCSLEHIKRRELRSLTLGLCAVFTVSYDKDEQFIHNRLEREKRCGKVERISENESKFSADVYDTSEMIPWIRTFICRITEINFSNKELEKKFFDDMEAMYKLYDLEGGEMK